MYNLLRIDKHSETEFTLVASREDKVIYIDFTKDNSSGISIIKPEDRYWNMFGQIMVENKERYKELMSSYRTD